MWTRIVVALVAPFALAACAAQRADADIPPAERERAKVVERGAAETKAELRERLTPLQWEVTQEDGTEPAYDNAYWDNKEAGIYVDVVSGEPLFSSKDKFRSGTGWPSFTRPLEPDHVVLEDDPGIFGTRTEVRSKEGDSHLGHVFDDGPPPTGKRYCLNSAALRFIPAERLEEEGYGEYARLFDEGRSGEKSE